MFKIVKICQICRFWVKFHQNRQFLTNLSDLVIAWMSTESSTKVDRYMSKLSILVKSVKFSWFWSKIAKIVNFGDLRVSRSLMNPNRNCQNWRFRQFWSISWNFDVFEYLKVINLMILAFPDNLHGDSLGTGGCSILINLMVVVQLISGWWNSENHDFHVLRVSWEMMYLI